MTKLTQSNTTIGSACDNEIYSNVIDVQTSNLNSVLFNSKLCRQIKSLTNGGRAKPTVSKRILAAAVSPV